MRTVLNGIEKIEEGFNKGLNRELTQKQFSVLAAMELNKIYEELNVDCIPADIKYSDIKSDFSDDEIEALINDLEESLQQLYKLENEVHNQYKLNSKKAIVKRVVAKQAAIDSVIIILKQILKNR